MDDAQKVKDARKLIEAAAEREGIELDVVKVHHDDVLSSTVINVRKGTDDGTYGVNIVIDDRADIGTNKISQTLQKAESQIRSLKYELSIECVVNGHELSFYLEDGFQAIDRTTGEEWEFSSEEMNLSTPTFSEGPPEFPPTIFDDIPYSVKEKMMMWVIAWSKEYSPEEWMMYENPLDRNI